MNTNPSGAPSATTGSTHSLPTFADLQQPDEVAYKADAFLQLVNRPCPQDWVKKHKFINAGKHEYLPIDKVRWLLTRAFGAFVKEEIISVQPAFNSVVVTARLHYCIPGTSTWLYQDGVGAVAVQTEKGEAAANLTAIKADAVMKAAPSAASFAISNAASKIGKVFGGDLNKDDALDFAGTYSSRPVEPQFQQWGGAQTPAQVTKAFLEANPPEQGPVMPASQSQPQPIYSPAQQQPAYAPNQGGYIL